jgi:hypothetical protein
MNKIWLGGGQPVRKSGFSQNWPTPLSVTPLLGELLGENMLIYFEILCAWIIAIYHVVLWQGFVV